jgi:hypothetical protein
MLVSISTDMEKRGKNLALNSVKQAKHRINGNLDSGGPRVYGLGFVA